MHFYLTGLLAYFLEGLLKSPPLKLGPLHVPKLGLLALIVSGIDELVVQSRISHRTATFHDFAGNSVGAIIFSYLALAARRWRRAER